MHCELDEACCLQIKGPQVQSCGMLEAVSASKVQETSGKTMATIGMVKGHVLYGKASSNHLKGARPRQCCLELAAKQRVHLQAVACHRRQHWCSKSARESQSEPRQSQVNM